MIYHNFKTLKDFKKKFKEDMQFLSSLSTIEIVKELNELQETITNWVYNFCSIEPVEGTNYINLFWTSEDNKTYNLINCFKEFTDFYNKLLDLTNILNSFCFIVDDFAAENWKF